MLKFFDERGVDVEEARSTNYAAAAGIAGTDGALRNRLEAGGVEPQEGPGRCFCAEPAYCFGWLARGSQTMSGREAEELVPRRSGGRPGSTLEVLTVNGLPSVGCHDCQRVPSP